MEAVPAFGRPPWWTKPDRRIAALSAGLAVVSVAVQGALSFWHRPALPNPAVVALLAFGFAATEGFTIHLRVRRSSHAIGLSEVPTVLALLVADPLTLLVTRLIGGVTGLTVLRRQRGIKLGFNVGLLAAQATVSGGVYAALVGVSHGIEPRQWAGAYAGILRTDVMAVVLITAAISLHDDPGEWRRLPAAMRGVPLAVVSTSIALVGALVVQKDVRALALLGVVSSIAFLAYRGYSRQSQGHAQVEALYAFTRALDGVLDSREAARIVVDRVRDQVRAESAELVMIAGDGTGTRVRMSGADQFETSGPGPVPAAAWWAPAIQGRPVLWSAGTDDGMAVPMPVGEDGTAVLLVTGSLPDIPTFDGDQLMLLQALANHASVALTKVGLVDRLREEVSEKERLALHDALTGLPNRRQFHRLLDAALATPSSHPTTVMLMDLDRFKEVNDALGHDTGDALLREIGVRIQRHLGNRGVVARLGGDEFGVLLTGGQSTTEAAEIGDDLVGVTEEPVNIGHLNLTSRASIGIAFAPQHGNDATSLLQRADVAMYAAKQTRVGRRVYHPQDDKNSPIRLTMIADLAKAIQHKELLVVFQPKVDPTTGIVVGAEALARWHHPEHGFVPPDEFIPLAEHSGLIRPLTLHVLETSLRRCAAWRRAGHDLHVAVNLSANGLLDTTLPDLVSRLLAQAGVPSSALTLEITESSIMADPTGSLMTLDRLHGIGVKLAIDDFGTGYSSLGRLRELPIHEVKIDKSFVQRVSVDHRDRAVVRSALQLGHALDLEVVAEGVEDGATYNQLSREGCNVVQGYFVSKPLPPDEFEEWLRTRATSTNVVYPKFGT